MPLWPQATLYIDEVLDSYVIRELVALSSPQHLADPGQRQVLDLRCLALCAALEQEGRTHAVVATRSPGERHAREAIRHIETRLEEIANVADVARAVGVSGEHLRHLFVRHAGKTLSSFLTEARIRRAAELLAHSRMPIKAVATACGYSNERYFCTVYHKATGLSPGRWRLKRMAGDDRNKYTALKTRARP